MKFGRSFKIALNILFHSRLRSWLTIIGIVIGIAAIVSIVSIGEGAQQRLEQNLNSVSADIITISSGFSRAIGMGAEFRGGFGEGFGSSSTSKAKNLTARDVIMLKSVGNLRYIMGIVSGNAEASYLGKNARVSVEGVDTSVWKNMVSTELFSGRYLIQGDIGSVVLGSRVANSTFSDVQINRQITIGGSVFKIVGILKESGSSDDSRIFMPIDNAVTIIEGKETGTFDSILVKINDISLTDTTISEITGKMMLSHSILQQNRKDFSVSSPRSLQETVSSTLNSMSLFLSAIAAISLIVGAIGIMNTMFTSVLEKTREIGILKAIGAKNFDIMNIFLLNSAIIGFIGGLFGVGLGILSSGLISQMAGATTQGGRMGLSQLLSSTYVSTHLIVAAFSVAIGIGLIAGAIPAWGASRLNPVEALRYE